MELCYTTQPSFNWNLHWVSSALRHYSSDEDDSDARRSSVGSTASSSSVVSSIEESMTSSGCSSSEDLAEERPRSLLPPPKTPTRKESLESSPRKSLSARYLEERGREYTVAPPTPDDDTLIMEKTFSEMSFDCIPSYGNSKPYGDEVCAPPPAAAAAAAAPVATWTLAEAEAAGLKVEEEEEDESLLHVEPAAAAAYAACSLSQGADTESASAACDELAHERCEEESVTIVEIDEEEIVEEEEMTPEVRQEEEEASSYEEAIEEEETHEGRQGEETPEMRQQDYSDTDSEIDTDEDGEIEDIASRHLRLAFNDMNSCLTAGDGNPIRHSLIHLAMEEDRPALLEAMSETYSFVFEDLSEERASTSTGIISAPNKERRAKEKRINFATEVAGVYTYLDEQSAETESEWREGVTVGIETYQSMVAAAAAEAEAAYMRDIDELARWNASIAASENVSSPDPMAELGSRHLVYT